ncbi:hypothetical protein BHC44_03965 [Snodgrassella alvi]|uniref:DUF7480 domain-containing protein n=1 Tax=Snodgrassella alvi TaxID=1196083 RepID=A0A2N9WRY3_9NEIS|nr:hypothetical protein [Snodgrassella alvi]PIT13047.1 hypothetical protein BGI32_11865 [Snodgrassella alvi]PIT15758.1 hypothetical protein BGI34_11150 [Snodgrassella alvi]PIT18909.1 hypothetical protein BGI33_00075 [Snodgrassella alvi]PIT53421.1 hypothetical protein BHC44_05785 [Snodgrassella alvi]PIT54493.1 hypothetical protein BHC44_03965 [Snodgrassella alvi]
MKQRYIYWLLMFLILPLLVSCISYNVPDIVLKDDGQPCISIPSDEDFFRRNKQFKIIFTDVFQTGIGELWSKDYQYSSKPYYVKTQECLRFDYHFQNNITYSVGFTSTEKGTDENKSWSRHMRIKKNKDGTLQLLLDEHARDVTQ